MAVAPKNTAKMTNGKRQVSNVIDARSAFRSADKADVALAA